MSTITATDARKSFFLRDCRINPFSPTPFPVSVNQNNELGGLTPFWTPFCGPLIRLPHKESSDGYGKDPAASDPLRYYPLLRAKGWYSNRRMYR